MPPTKKPLEAAPTIPLELLDSEKNIIAPLFQRRYVWEKKQLDQLWIDIDSILDQEDDARFLGAIVLVDRTSGLAFEPRSYWIIDGQQRITSIYLLLLAIAEVASKDDEQELATNIVESYLLNQKGKFANQPKIRPTFQDLRQWSEIHASVKPEFDPSPPQPFGDEDGPMLAAYKSLRREVKSRHKTYGGDYLAKLAHVILEGLRFVEISLSSEENPNQVYDALNTQGKKLDVFDLIRNSVFGRLIDDPEKAQKLYNSDWIELETALGADAAAYVFPFTLIHESSATKARVFQILQERWMDWKPIKIIEDLSTYVPTFKAIVHGTHLEVSDDLSSGIDRLRRMPAPTATYPFIMQVVYQSLIGDLDDKLAAKNLQLIEALLVRRALGGFEPTGLHAVFKTMWTDSGGDPKEFIRVIDKNPTIDFPDDEQFIADIKSKQLYRRKLKEYIVTEYERSLGGDPIPMDPAISIDHIMPQKLSPDWEKVVSVEIHEDLVDTWANLVPLSQPFNSEKGQKTWDEIRERFEDESVFKTPRQVAKAYKKWDATTIRKRADVLAEWAVGRWPKKS